MSERRRQYYTDQKLQGYLLFVLIAMQIVLVSVLLYFLYWDINELIEKHIYRIHSKGVNSWSDIFSLVAITMSMFLLLNIILLYLAHSAWSHYIKGIISQFSSVLDRIVSQDFTGTALSVTTGHKMLQLVAQWFVKEQRRHREINTLLVQLSGYKNKEIKHDDRMQLQKVLQDYKRLLVSR